MTASIAFGLGTRLLVGGLLLFGGAAKLSAGNGFRVSWLGAFVALPKKLLGVAAVALSLIEVAVGSGFLLAIGGRASAWAAAALLTAINVVGVTTLLRGKRPSCGCAGDFSKSPISWRLVARNAAFIFAAALIGITGVVGPALTSVPGPIAAGTWMAFAAATVAAVYWLATNRSAAHRASQQLRLQPTESAEG